MRRLVLILVVANIVTFGIGFEARMRASLESAGADSLAEAPLIEVLDATPDSLPASFAAEPIPGGVSSDRRARLPETEPLPADYSEAPLDEGMDEQTEAPGRTNADAAEPSPTALDLAPPEPVVLDGPKALRPEARPRLCARLGPFSSATAAEALGSIMAPGAVLALGSQAGSGEASPRFWIHLPPTDDETAAARMAELEAAGLSDILWLRTGPHAGAISLGLYSSSRTRDKRLAELRGAGIEPSVEVREARPTEYWAHLGFPDLDSRLAADAWLAARQRDSDSGAAFALIPEPCDTVASKATDTNGLADPTSRSNPVD